MPTEFIMIRYFEESLKLSIKAEIDQDNSQLIDYKKLVAKAVRAKTKLGLQASFYIRKTDLNYLWGSWLAHITVYKVQTQGAVKDYCRDDSKACKANASTQEFKPSNKARKDKKKSIIETKGIPENPKILLSRSLKSTRPRSMGVDKVGRTKKT